MTITDLLCDGRLLQSIGAVGIVLGSVVATETTNARGTVQAVAADTDAEREAVRKRHGLRLVTGEEEGYGIGRLPDGVYGFTYSPLTETPVFAKQHYNSFEVHKLPGGDWQLLVWVRPEEAAKIRSARTDVQLKLYPNRWEDATEMIVVPARRLSTRKLLPSREPGNWIQPTLYPEG